MFSIKNSEKHGYIGPKASPYIPQSIAKGGRNSCLHREPSLALVSHRLQTTHCTLVPGGRLRAPGRAKAYGSLRLMTMTNFLKNFFKEKAFKVSPGSKSRAYLKPWRPPK